jgi:prepilin-type N-terminal cleavage/methylation domain-containing protein
MFPACWRLRKNQPNGFTLIEVLLVAMVIAILAAIAIPRAVIGARHAREAALEGDLREIRAAISRFEANTGCYPLHLSDLTMATPPASGVDVTGTLIPIDPKDYVGPYLVNPDGLMTKDPISNQPNWTYSTTTPTVGHVHSSSPGMTLDGVAYSDL